MTNYAVNAPDILTTLFPKGVEELFMEEFPSYGLFEKKMDYLAEGGRELNWQLDSGGGDATTVTEAEANEGPSDHVRPKITRVREYATATVEREDILATRNDKDRIMEVWDLAIRNCLRKLKRQWGMQLFRDGTGARARLAAAASGVGTATVILENANDAKLFEAGDWLQGTADLATLRNAGAKIKITGRNIGNGTLTAGGAWTGSIAALTDHDYLVRSGDLNNVVKGIAAWIPPTAPDAGASFFGVVRDALGEGAFGHRPTFSSSSLFSIGIDAAAYLFDVAGASPDIWLVNSLDMAGICKDATGLEQIIIPGKGLDGKAQVEIGYEAARVNGPNGKIDVVADPFCKRGQSWMGTREEGQWWTLGALIDRITMGMGNENGFVKAGVDGVGIRFGGFGNFVVTRPWHWAYCALPTG